MHIKLEQLIRSKMSEGIGVIFTIFYLLSAFARPVLIAAQTTTPITTEESEVQDIATTEISGDVLKIEGRMLYIQTNNGVKQVEVPDNIVIVKNGNEVGFNEIGTNDNVVVTQTQEGTVLSVEVSEGGILNFSDPVIKWVVIAAAALILIGLLWWFISRANKPHIKT
jgi:hypothetical protein